MIRHQGWARSALYLLLAGVLSACINLSAIQEFGKLSADTAGYTKLTNDYITSPNRQAKYTLIRESDAQATLEKASLARKTQEPALKAYQQTIVDYMGAISDLAGDQVTSFDAQLGPLIDAAAGSNLIPASKAAALKSVSEIVAEAATGYYRQRQLSKVIGSANAPLQNVLSDFAVIVAGYRSSIQNEEQSFTDYYRLLLAMAGPDRKGQPDREPVAVEMLTRSSDELRPQFATRLKDVDSFGAAIKKIGEAHQKLYDDRDKLNQEATLAAIKKFSREIYSSYKAIRASDSEK